MVEAVEDHKLYQVTVSNAYKQAFVLGQKVAVGTEDNPFFRFYETVLEYDVPDGNTGAILRVNVVEWLHRVRMGTIIPQAGFLAATAWSVSQHYMMLARELLMEQIRLEEFDGEPPSRQKCLYLSNNPEEARGWIPLVGGNGTVCELSCTGKIHLADSRLMVMLSEPLATTREKARAYWRGEASSEPRMEALFEGNAVVTALGL